MIVETGWEKVQLGKQINLLNGYAFPSECFSQGDGISLIRIRDLGKNETEVTFAGKYSEQYIVTKGDLLIGMDGDFCTVLWKGEQSLLNQRVCKLTSKNNNMLSEKFLYYRIIEEVIFINKITSATTVKHLSSNDITKIEIDLPPISEQIKIEEVLSTVDRAIEQTETIIAKQQRIKTGLMQDLLTKGIDENGNIRSEKTHKFKDSPLGRIPVEWDECRLDQIVDESITYGIVQAGKHVETGIPYIRTGDMSGDFLEIDKLLRTSETIAKSYKRSTVYHNDIVFALRATVGKVLLIPLELSGANLTQGTAKISPSNKVCALYLLWAMRAAYIAKQILQTQKGTTFSEITLRDLRNILVAIPRSNDEQNEIMKFFQKHDFLLQKEKFALQKLERIKTSLMQDLLTGKVRVTNLLK